MTASERPTVLPALWLLGFTILSAAPVLRLGDVQLLEIAQALSVIGAVLWYAFGGFRFRLPDAWRQYGGAYVVLLILCAAGSVFALRLEFYPPPETAALKQPLVLSIARLLELSLVIYSMLAAASAMRRNPELLRVALDAYSGLAAVTAVASLVSWILLQVGHIPTPFVYGFDSRVRGFFNEGGPYGMFLVSAGVAEILRARLFPRVYRFRTTAALVLFAIALLLSGSKAGLLAMVFLSFIAGVAAGNGRQKAMLVFSGVVVLTVTGALFANKFITYWILYEHVEEAAAYHPDDPNYVMGRVTGALIVPRMIAAHPLGGIGLGNYSLMRNDPEYLQGLPAVDEWDLPGMGLLGAAAELGAPLALFLLGVLLRPFWRTLRRRGNMSLAVAAVFQPVALLFGVNLNFFYPWLITAFAIAAEPLAARHAASCRPGCPSGPVTRSNSVTAEPLAGQYGAPVVTGAPLL
jgi:hypothetical protein